MCNSETEICDEIMKCVIEMCVTVRKLMILSKRTFIFELVILT